MTVVETLNNKLTLGGKVDSPFYFSKGAFSDIEINSNTMAGAAYPMSVSFDLNSPSINQAIDQVRDAFDSAIRSDLIHSTKPFYQEFEKAIIEVLIDLKTSMNK